ncbi:MAG: hypothetical protein V3W04_05370 [Gammaproteobacteria bacterium]
MKSQSSENVLRLADHSRQAVIGLLKDYSLQLVVCNPGKAIPGSFWGDAEAGLIQQQLFAWPDTPLHSIFHEACHFICMSSERREALDTNAGGDYAEENAVCYLQILLADVLPGFGRQRMMADMDVWGYSFRLGSTAAWFEQDADDARQWLQAHDLIDAACIPRKRLTGC